jgi:hypothetical protein
MKKISFRISNGNGSANGMNHHFDEHVQDCINEDSRVCGV